MPWSGGAGGATAASLRLLLLPTTVHDDDGGTPDVHDSWLNVVSSSAKSDSGTPFPYARPRGVGSTSFREVSCADGYKCVSKVKTFGLGHDGVFTKKPPANDLPEKFKTAYEWGCPARGQVDNNGLCKAPSDDNGGGKGDMCYSMKRYESGDGMPCANDDCFCVRPVTAQGNPGSRERRFQSVVKGQEIRSGEFLVQQEEKCHSCSDHDNNKKACDDCDNCEYTTQEIEIPSRRGKPEKRMQLGCFDISASEKVAHERSKTRELEYLKGREPVKRDVQVIPHYRLWDPSAAEDAEEKIAEADVSETQDDDTSQSTVRLPYQSRREPLGREEWLKQYKEAAPRIQKTLDLLRMRLLEGTATEGPWSPVRDPKTGARSVGPEKCWTPSKPGDDLQGKLDKFLAVNRVCKHMQDTARLLSDGGESVSFSGGPDECGAFFWDVANHQRTCGCHHGTGKDAQNCLALNCYADGADAADNAVAAIVQRLHACSKMVRDAGWDSLVKKLPHEFEQDGASAETEAKRDEEEKAAAAVAAAADDDDDGVSVKAGSVPVEIVACVTCTVPSSLQTMRDLGSTSVATTPCCGRPRPSWCRAELRDFLDVPGLRGAAGSKCGTCYFH